MAAVEMYVYVYIYTYNYKYTIACTTYTTYSTYTCIHATLIHSFITLTCKVESISCHRLNTSAMKERESSGGGN